MTMRALADYKTGELRINGRWIRAAAIESAAEFCRDIRLRGMRELVAIGLVTYDFERVVRFIGGRRRVVRGRTRYVVHKEAITPNSGSSTAQNPNVLGGSVREIIEKPRILLKSISSTVEEIDSQDLSEAPTGGDAGRIGGCGGAAQTHHNPPNPQNPEPPKPRAQTPSTANSSAKEEKDRRNIEARDAREAREQEVKINAHVGGIPDGRSMLCNMCGFRFSREEYANHVCPVEQKLGTDTRQHQRENGDALAKSATA
jgi:hypothetical protein